MRGLSASAIFAALVLLIMATAQACSNNDVWAWSCSVSPGAYTLDITNTSDQPATTPESVTLIFQAETAMAGTVVAVLGDNGIPVKAQQTTILTGSVPITPAPTSCTVAG